MVDIGWHETARTLWKANPELWTLARLCKRFKRSKTTIWNVLHPEYIKTYRIVNRKHILKTKLEYYHNNKIRLNLLRYAHQESKATGIPKDIILQNWGVK